MGVGGPLQLINFIGVYDLSIKKAHEKIMCPSGLCSSPCHVVYTDYRPTPLEHYIFPAGGDGLFLVVDQKTTFR